MLTNEQKAHDLAILLVGKKFDMDMSAKKANGEVNENFSFSDYAHAYNVIYSSVLKEFSEKE